MPTARRVMIAVALAAVLLVSLVGLAAQAYSSALGGPVTVAEAPAAAASADTYNTLRVYGRANAGAGSLADFGPPPNPYGVMVSAVTDLLPPFAIPEDAPYVPVAPLIAEPVFNPQLQQAPIKDSVTWNPAYMSEAAQDENQAKGLYGRIFVGAGNGAEKVWFRMWYEPWHWDKDLNANNTLDINPLTQMPFTGTQTTDEWYPAVMQEFTYMLLDPRPVSENPPPVFGPVGETSFVFPVGMRKNDLFVNGQVPLVDTASANARYGYGVTSLDGDFDGVPDIVRVESENTLFQKTHIAADFDGNGVIDNLDIGALPLSGDELAILRLDSKSLARNQAVQFLDHLIIVKDVSDVTAQLEVWYTGDKVPRRLDQRSLGVGDMLLSGSQGPSDHLRAINAAGTGTGTNPACKLATGPFFAYLEALDTAEGKARLWVGRALGHTYGAMEVAPNQPDLTPGDPWFLKRFYVDGHEYNVVAINTLLGGPTFLAIPPLPFCSIDFFAPFGVPDPPFAAPPADPTLFGFITIRTPVPKTGPYSDPVQAAYLIEQHSVWLQAYALLEYLSVMPPYNHEHYIITDVRARDSFTCLQADVRYFGDLVGPVAPILPKNGPFPYVGVGARSPYNTRREMALFYIEEAKNKQYLGSLKEMYGETVGFPPEFFYDEQFHTLPWEYTEFVLPDLNSADTPREPDRYLLTTSFLSEYSEDILRQQTTVGEGADPVYNPLFLVWLGPPTNCWYDNTPVDGLPVPVPPPPPPGMPAGWTPRVKFWFDPESGGKKYKDGQGLRLYGLEGFEAGDPAAIENNGLPLEVLPYKDSWAPFNPEFPQAPPMDSLTFNPAYMDEYNHSGESLASLYAQISIREQNAREKVYLRMWYDPQYVDTILLPGAPTLPPAAPGPPTEAYSMPVVMQELTYLYVNTNDQPAPAAPGSSSFAFPVATGRDELPAPDTGTRELPPSRLPSFGYGLTTFDPDFDGQPDAVRVHSELSLQALTGIGADFDGNAALDPLFSATFPVPVPAGTMNGGEMVIFATPEKTLGRGQSLQFLDYMVTVENVSPGQAELKFWYTGGGLHPVSGEYSLQPDAIDTRSVLVRGMAIAGRTRTWIRVLAPGGTNAPPVLGTPGDGPWFVFVQDVNSTSETVTLVAGRALGHANTAMGNGAGAHDLNAGDPWYLKRFFVDGHEYNVVALRIEPSALPAPEGPFAFKYITIRTPVPKINFVNSLDSQKLEGYFLGTVFGVDTAVMSVMPPFNYNHTVVEDIITIPERDKIPLLPGVPPPVGWELGEFVFGNPNFLDLDCRGDLKNHAPYQIRIVEEAREEQFLGELRELYSQLPGGGAGPVVVHWETEQWHVRPDRYTELRLPGGEKYLLTSNWLADQSQVAYNACAPGPALQVALSALTIPPGLIPAPNIVALPPNAQTFYQSVRVVGLPLPLPLVPAPPPPRVNVPPVPPLLRVKFLYDPTDAALNKDLYVNTWTEPAPPVTPTPTATPTLVATPTPTRTATPLPGATGSISGTVKLQGRSNYSGAVVTAGSASATTGADGRFTLSGLAAGTYTVRAAMVGYLYSEKADVVVNSGATTAVPTVQLYGGDACGPGGTPADCKIDLFDLVWVALHYNSSPPSDPRADLNGNGAVDIYDLVLVGTNLDKACPALWVTPAATSLQVAASGRVRVAPVLQRVDKDEVFNVTLEVEDVNNFYGADIRVEFAANLLEVLDADPFREGVQVVHGTFPAPADSAVVLDEADNRAGTASYAFTLMKVPPASGGGELCRITFRAKKAGWSPLRVTSAELLDHNARDIEVTVYDGAVSIGQSVLFLPIVSVPTQP